MDLTTAATFRHNSTFECGFVEGADAGFRKRKACPFFQVELEWTQSTLRSDPNGKQFAHGGGVVLTPLSDSDEKSPAQLQQALAQCDAELAEYKRRFGSIGNGNKPERPAPPRGWPSTLDYTNKGCTPTNHKKTITVYPRLYEIHHNHNLEGSKILGDIVVDNIRDCAVKCADLPGHERCAGASFYILPNHNPKCILYSEMRNIHPAAYARTQTNCMLVEISAYGRR
ncbi:hypothetical protein BDV25DRAFT_140675 [Aspergillus avenaceus]|uniref:Apple domain-containing protein n=1 Tax=Aspergillus avenaceus TaxID=36643 RepID=A0A5N6TT74_ASPAV|nr:hypothetical protein BDV25DRAFT_140675 [Aspergillus avenaceus]